MTPAEPLLAELSRVLWQQRALIEVLQYRLEVQQLMMVAGRDQRLPMAVEEVELTLADIAHVEELRDRVVRDVAAELGLPPGATITQICERAEAPWDFVLGDHQTNLLMLVADAEELATRNKELAHRGLEDSRTLFRQMNGEVTVSAYGRSGSRTSTLALPPSLVDRDA